MGVLNHWLFDQPRAMYRHFESIEPPLEFARKIREAFRVLKASFLIKPIIKLR
jgi:hypothetical protein